MTAKHYYFITGSSAGLGKALCELLLSEPHNMVVGLSRRCSIEHDRYTHVSIDLSNIEALTAYEFPELHEEDKIVLVNNAGSLGEIKYMGELNDHHLVQQLNANLLAPVLLMNKFIRAYHQIAASKVIVNIGSGASTNPYDGWSLYCTAKAGLEMVSRASALEQTIQQSYPPFHVLSIAPGVVDTAMQAHIRETDASNFSRLDKFVEMKNEQKLYAAADVAKVLKEFIDQPEAKEGLVHRIVL
jgi:benzil reductase ((S)-benzoin forming)